MSNGLNSHNHINGVNVPQPEDDSDQDSDSSSSVSSLDTVEINEQFVHRHNRLFQSDSNTIQVPYPLPVDDQENEVTKDAARTDSLLPFASVVIRRMGPIRPSAAHPHAQPVGDARHPQPLWMPTLPRRNLEVRQESPSVIVAGIAASW